VVLGLIWFVTGQNPIDILTNGGTMSSGSSTSSSSWAPASNASEDELANFVGVVVKDTEDYWGEVFRASNETYTPPKVVLFSDTTQSGCGTAQSASGPFYCPNDRKVYIELAFYDQLRRQFGAPGDFAQAYVIAHEVGDHIQNLTGVLPEFNRRRAAMSQEQQNADRCASSCRPIAMPGCGPISRGGKTTWNPVTPKRRSTLPTPSVTTR